MVVSHSTHERRRLLLLLCSNTVYRSNLTHLRAPDASTMTQGLPCFLDLAPLCHITSLRQEGTKSRTAAPSWFSSWRYLGVVAMAEAGRGLPSSKGVSCEAYASVYKPHRYCACSSAWRSATGVAAASFLARAAACCARCCLRLACKQGNGWGGLRNYYTVVCFCSLLHTLRRSRRARWAALICLGWGGSSVWQGNVV